MKTSYLQVFVILAAVSSGIYTTATITVSSSTTKQATPSTDLYKYAKQWTVSGSSNSDKIDTLDISLTGNVFMSYTDSLPKGVLGYLNVSGDSQTVVDAVTVTYKRFLNVSAAATQSDRDLAVSERWSGSLRLFSISQRCHQRRSPRHQQFRRRFGDRH
ncbi:hypothetical protein F444_22220 [Phytophthora nicotianae P1976]|uniref:Uncharacterized protein n=1 Tax=Phytophthora nicotianae P1976 TaxID=1317066 RepID=A0A080YYF9_PHYNI|nr:hypothetical protein F444_22220 [Phytophthora nicotianae P1976]